MNIFDFQNRKVNQIPIPMVTCYDFWSACLIAKTDIIGVLVGDTSAMIMHGESTTIPATTEIIALHTKAVVKGASNKFIIADMPFLSFRKGIYRALDNAEQLMQAGAKAVKVEGVAGHEDVIEHLVASGIPVMGHLGLTPQSVHQLGGFKLQGKGNKERDKLFADAYTLEKLGCFSIVLECIPTKLAEMITKNLSIPTIGIGAGNCVDGQILVLQDLLGTEQQLKPKFVKQFLNGSELIQSALQTYCQEVITRDFPSVEYSYD